LHDVETRPIPNSDRLTELFRSNQLAEELAAYHDGDSDGTSTFAHACVAAHNAGHIDLLAVVAQPAFVALDQYEFFAAQQVYCDAIPHITADANALMMCCRTLVERAGQDLAGNMPYAAFRQWCANHIDQTVRIIEDAKEGNEPARGLVTFVLQGANAVEQAVYFVEEFCDERQLYGMTALGGMTFPDVAAAHAAAKLLETFVDAQWGDRVRCNALGAAFGILTQHPDADMARQLVDAASHLPGPDTRHALAQVLFQRQVTLETETTRTALSVMSDVEENFASTRRLVANAICRMLDTPEETVALNTLSELLDRGWSLEDLETVFHKLGGGTPQRRDALVIRWLLSDSIRLGAAVSHIARQGRNAGFSLDMNAPALTEAEQIIVCRKAIAFLFMHPKSCCGVLLAVLRSADKVVQGFVEQLLVNPLLMSYGSLRAHLATLPDTDPAFVSVQTALEEFRLHRETLNTVEILRELRPSERQRNAVRARSTEQMHEAMKAAEKSSALFNLFRRTHVLHGRRTLTFVENSDGTKRAIPIDLHPHSTSIEFPSLEWLDPVGLDCMLRSWRVARSS
jgi:hypothetical protein